MSDLVSFTVVCKPESGVGRDELGHKLNVKTIYECLAKPSTIVYVAQQLKDRGFEVFDETAEESLDVHARGSVGLFESVFATKLEKRVRSAGWGPNTYNQEWFVVKPGSPEPDVTSIDGALFIALSAPPLFFAPRIPPVIAGFNLRAPGDIAQLTRASPVHRRQTASGNQSTGGGVGVAVIDTGFHPHPFYQDHRYRIKRAAASDTTNPEQDDVGHGTSMLANLFACGPDVQCHAVKMGPSAALAFVRARMFSIRVITLSWGYDLASEAVFPPNLWPLRKQIAKAIADGIIVVAAGGNLGVQAFPAMMPEVIAVGGVNIDVADTLTVWNGASSFVNPLFPARNVPDFCGLASTILLPIPPASGVTWDAVPGTSCAAPQVAGICALLLQKKPALTPQLVRSVLLETATDITVGSSATGQMAAVGFDPASGAGLVNALAAWKGIS